MKLGSRQAILAAVVLAVVWVIGVGLAASGMKLTAASAVESSKPATTAVAVTKAGKPLSGRELAMAMGIQAPAAGQGAQMSDVVFKNVQVLKGIPVDDFMGTMGIMAASLGFCCADCHDNAGTDQVKWEEDNAKKRTARRMTTMVMNINKENFGGRQVVTCWTCHRGRDRPVVTPSLEYIYSTPMTEDDDVLTPAKGVPTVDQVFDKYLQALGGAQKVATLKSYVAKGPSEGYGGYGGGATIEIDAQAPDKHATYLHFEDPDRDDAIRSFDGTTGWAQIPLSVLGHYSLKGAELDGQRFDAQMAFPAQLKGSLTNWRVAGPILIDEKKHQTVQGNGPRGIFATLYFDDQTGLLSRIVRYAPSPIGRVPTQVDYSDYRDVNGIKMPFHQIFTWLDGREVYQLSGFQLNVNIDPAKFGEPKLPPKRAR